jgi:hypothetical protein
MGFSPAFRGLRENVKPFEDITNNYDIRTSKATKKTGVRALLMLVQKPKKRSKVVYKVSVNHEESI